MSTNDLDELMFRDPVDLTKQDIDRIIDYHRAQRARRASGERPTKPSAAVGLDISDITNKLVTAAKPEVKITRRI